MIDVKLKSKGTEGGIHFNIDTNFRCAILGENGIGKSCLLHAIANKKSSYDFIELNVPAHLRIEYFKQLEENSLLSGGEHTKKRLEETFSKEADIYVLDEPTNNLDETNIHWLKTVILKNNKKIIFTSHDIDFINDIAEFIYYIDNTTVEKTKEKCSLYLVTRKRKIDTLYSEYKINVRKQKQLIKTSQELKEKAKQGDTHKRKDKDKLEQGLNREGAGKGARVSRIVLEKAENLVVEKPKYDPIPEIVLNDNKNKNSLFSLQVTTLSSKRCTIEIRNNTKLIITGINGAGKTTLLNYIDSILQGGEVRTTDMFSRYSKFNYLYITQDWYEKLDDIIVKNYFYDFHLDEQEIFQALSRSYLTRDILNKKFKEISPGMRIKILLGILSSQSYDLIIWDEPTNHLDVLTQNILSKAFIQYEGALILVTHDKYFTNNNAYGVVSL